MPHLVEDPVNVPEPDKYRITQFLGRQSDPRRDNLSVALEVIESGVRKPQHFHRASDELFYVVSGSGFLTIEGVQHRLTAGDAYLVEVGQKHFLAAADDEQLSVLLVSTPAYEPSDYILC
ncbi:hypothetical protein Amn_45150 [Aminobacter sp. Y103A]|uniref:cupin domain-containing protein n=1 Tax=Aminobacter sp. Y103A TaxID=1870862 RepID=UPI0025725B53|nr:cupin domain-containing protein [Aminobacter sp. SS-2016]BBD39635.1 hypothetical protein Amn_45150 [Aminobacter sp. SS-2016]